MNPYREWLDEGFIHLTDLPERDHVAHSESSVTRRQQTFGYTQEELRSQASRCMDCGIPFCHNGCPLGNLIPEWNDHAWRDDLPAAIESLHATNNFPDFTGRLCPAPCETACVLGINQPAVTIKNIEQTIIDRAFDDGLVTPQIADRHTAYTVAVLGSGPAGLAAAQQLARAGHTVIVYEKSDRIGGLLRYGIPESKMEKAVLDRCLSQLEAEGVRFVPNTEVGVEITGEDLIERYDAVVIATGTPLRRDLPAPGRELGGIHQAMDYLPQATRVVHGETIANQIHAADKDVVIIGGGDTGADCLGTALRQGVRSVTQLEIMPRPSDDRPEHQPWPTYPMIYRIASANEEGGERVYATSTVEFLDREGGGNVTHLAAQGVTFESGRFTPVEGSEREIPAQLVLLAMGFTGMPQDGLVAQLGLEVDERGRVARGQDFATAAPGVFVAGDSGRGQSLIVWAIAEGRAAAASVDAYLRGGPSELPAPITATTVQLTV